MDYQLGWLKKPDIEEALKIEWYTAQNFWNKSDFEKIFTISNLRCVVPLVCRLEVKPRYNFLAGYCIYKHTKDSYNILNMVVHPEYRRMGVGTLFIKNLLFKTKKGDRKFIRIRIRDSEESHSAKKFLRSMHFTLDGIVPEFYNQYDKFGNIIGKEDAIEYYIAT